MVRMKKFAGNKVGQVAKRALHGQVVSNANDPAIVARVERRFTHPVLKKTVHRAKKYAGGNTDVHPVGKTEDGVAILHPAAAPTHVSRSEIQAAVDQMRNAKLHP